MTWYVTGIANTPQGRIIALKNSGGQVTRMPEPQLIQAVRARQVELANAGVNGTQIVPMNRTAPVAKQKGNKLSTYSVIGRYMNGRNVLAYQIQNDSTGVQHKVARQKLIDLCQRGQMTNCRVQKDPTRVAAGEAPRESCMLIRGININMNTLPIFDEKNGVMRRTESLGAARIKGAPQNAFGRLRITAKLVCGRNTIGYVVTNAGGTSKKLRTEQVAQLIQQKQIGNARLQMDRGQLLVRGIGDDFTSIPKILVDMNGNEVSPDTVARKPGQRVAGQSTRQAARPGAVSPGATRGMGKGYINNKQCSIKYLSNYVDLNQLVPAKNSQPIQSFLRGVDTNIFLMDLMKQQGKIVMLSKDANGNKYYYIVRPSASARGNNGVQTGNFLSINVACKCLGNANCNVFNAASIAKQSQSAPEYAQARFTGLSNMTKNDIISAAIAVAYLGIGHGPISQIALSYRGKSVGAAVNIKTSDIKRLEQHFKPLDSQQSA